MNFKKKGLINDNFCENCRIFMTMINKTQGVFLKFKCKKCNSYKSDISGTFFGNMKISFQKFAIIMHYFIINESPKKVHDYFNFPIMNRVFHSQQSNIILENY